MPKDNLALGMIAGVSTDLLSEIPVDLAMGYVPAIQFHEGLDPSKPQVFSIRTGDVITTGIGAILSEFGKGTQKSTGKGMLIGVGAIKLVELLAYFAMKAGVNYQEISPWPLTAKAKASIPTPIGAASANLDAPVRVKAGNATIFGSAIPKQTTGTRQTPTLETNAFSGNHLLV